MPRPVIQRIVRDLNHLNTYDVSAGTTLKPEEPFLAQRIECFSRGFLIGRFATDRENHHLEFNRICELTQ